MTVEQLFCPPTKKTAVESSTCQLAWLAASLASWQERILSNLAGLAQLAGGSSSRARASSSSSLILCSINTLRSLHGMLVTGRLAQLGWAYQPTRCGLGTYENLVFFFALKSLFDFFFCG
jgi:hypothetical protein